MIFWKFYDNSINSDDLDMMTKMLGVINNGGNGHGNGGGNGQDGVWNESQQTNFRILLFFFQGCYHHYNFRQDVVSHFVFSNDSSKNFNQNMHLFDFTPLCIFKCFLKLLGSEHA